MFGTPNRSLAVGANLVPSILLLISQQGSRQERLPGRFPFNQNFRDCVQANGRRLRIGLVPFTSRDKFRAHFQNGRCWVFVVLEDFEFTNHIKDDDNDIVMFSVVSCLMRLNVTRKSGYFEQTVSSHLPGVVCFSIIFVWQEKRRNYANGRLPLGIVSGRWPRTATEFSGQVFLLLSK